MKFFTAALQGSVLFVTLLISQVIIVTSLALTALWLYFKRLQNGSNEEDEESSKGSENSSPSVSDEFLSQLQQKLVALEKEKAEYLQSDAVQALSAEKAKSEELQKINQETLKKIQGLESRLLEYGVLQEEIGLLTQFKSENEKLKATVEDLQKQISQSTSGKKEEKAVHQEFATPMAAPETPVVAVQTQSGNPEATPLSDPGLEGLLNEIEALTGDKKNNLKKAS